MITLVNSVTNLESFTIVEALLITSATTSIVVGVLSSLVYKYVPLLLFAKVVTVSSVLTTFVTSVINFGSFTIVDALLITSATTSIVVGVLSSLVYKYVPLLLLAKVVTVSAAPTKSTN
ncbi:hypothetical protein FLA105535_01638 [Flavobacterium bizetiae]|nr:hypothetical protein FLA105535_01638 [Flavobacterium bizetiae]